MVDAFYQYYCLSDYFIMQYLLISSKQLKTVLDSLVTEAFDSRTTITASSLPQSKTIVYTVADHFDQGWNNTVLLPWLSFGAWASILDDNNTYTDFTNNMGQLW